jgi:hypothetical protein
MAVLAVGLASVERRDALASQYVLSGRNGLEVVGVDTDSVATEMVNLQSLGDVANVKLVGNTMGKQLPLLASDAPVAIRSDVAIPIPTTVANVGMRPKPLLP